MLEDVRAGKPDLWEEARVGVRAADDYTLEMELRSPMPQLPLLLLHCTWFPVPRHAVEARGGMLDRTGGMDAARSGRRERTFSHGGAPVQ